MLDNNLLLSRASLLNRSQGGAYVHNLFGGTIQIPAYDGRQTPFLKAHSTQIAGFHDNPRGDDRYYNNLFTQADLSQYNDTKLPMWMAGNVFFGESKPSRYEADPLVMPDFDLASRLVQQPDGVVLEIRCDPAWTTERKRKLVTGALLGKAGIPDLGYEQADGTPIWVDTDYFGKKRNQRTPSPGPFEKPGKGLMRIKVWEHNITSEH
jgi:alpha-N-arabinofuranosidase